jgi:hypothetical protein
VTIGTVISEVAPAIAIDVPDNIFGSAERAHVELVALANEMAQRIAEHHEWQAIKRLQSYTGNGENDAWDLPDGYDRMPGKQAVWSTRMVMPLEHVQDHDVWLDRLVTNTAIPVGSWTLLGGQMVFNPVLASGEVAKFYYLTDYIVEDSDGALKATFTASTDTFRLDERLLKLGIIAQWRANKGVADDFAEYEKLLADRVVREAGPRAFAVGRPTMTGDATTALPWTIVP